MNREGLDPLTSETGSLRTFHRIEQGDFIAFPAATLILRSANSVSVSSDARTAWRWSSKRSRHSRGPPDLRFSRLYTSGASQTRGASRQAPLGHIHRTQPAGEHPARAENCMEAAEHYGLRNTQSCFPLPLGSVRRLPPLPPPFLSLPFPFTFRSAPFAYLSLTWSSIAGGARCRRGRRTAADSAPAAAAKCSPPVRF